MPYLTIFICQVLYSLHTSRRIEVRHPVYALLFQCVALQTSCQALLSAALLAMRLGGVSLTRWAGVDLLLSTHVRQFYEVTWACVSHLR